jgi:hypothetical protein
MKYFDVARRNMQPTQWLGCVPTSGDYVIYCEVN